MRPGGGRFLAILAAAGALLIAGLFLGPRYLDRRGGEPPPLITAGPYLQNVGPDRITVSWETDVDGAGRVDLGLTPAYGTVSRREGARTPCQRVIHHHEITGLAPSTAYHYRVSSGGTTSADAVFRTAPAGPEPFRFVVYGDSRAALGGFVGAHAAVVRSILARSPAEIVLHTGDFTDNGALCRGWEEHHGWDKEFFGPAAALLRTAPIAAVPGNHDYYASPEPHLIVDPPRLFQVYFDPGERGTTWRSFTYGCVDFILLDSNANRKAGDISPGSPQYAWLEQELGKPSERWKVVLLHFPPFSSRDSNGPKRAVREYLVPLFERYRVPLVFAGHDHFYERSFKDGVTYVMTGGGGEPLYPDNRRDLNPYRVVSMPAHQHCHATASPDLMTVVCRDTAGVELDRFTLRRGDGAPAPPGSGVGGSPRR